MITENKPIFTIGTAAKMLETEPRTLRAYEKEGLVKPIRRGQWRYYNLDDLKWIGCLKGMVDEQGISTAAIKKLLSYTTCWEIAGCSFNNRKQCTAFMSNGLVPKKIKLRVLTGGGMAA
jgi:MerR family transcriptional regulator, heat shock protein HspR